MNIQMQSSGATFTVDDNVAMSDVLKLCLSSKQEDLAEVCNIAGKELTIEIKLHTIESNWSNRMLEYVMHDASGMPLLVASKTSELVQDLQEEQVCVCACMCPCACTP
jgi:hypothetical protein